MINKWHLYTELPILFFYGLDLPQNIYIMQLACHYTVLA